MEEAGLLAPLLLSSKLVDIATALALVAFLCETIASDFRFPTLLFPASPVAAVPTYRQLS